ncbi:NUDIX domain-containing protein [Nocardioides sp. AE5]|uniref:NUDIX domain-containing protein n=1 Tax=Nocardioides sp. AE5 TaxID=2962573 RepID=UPI0037C97F11
MGQERCAGQDPPIQVGAGVERNVRTHLLQESGRGKDSVPTAEWRGECVAVVLSWRDKVGLFKRSQLVDSDRGRWHCVTGHLDRGRSPFQQAVQELHEETGLGAASLEHLCARPALTLPDPRGGHWLVHTFHALTLQRRLSLNWEHDSYRWVSPKRLDRFDGKVPWLTEVLAHTLLDGRGECSSPACASLLTSGPAVAPAR